MAGEDEKESLGAGHTDGHHRPDQAELRAVDRHASSEGERLGRLTKPGGRMER